MFSRRSILALLPTATPPVALPHQGARNRQASCVSVRRANQHLSPRSRTMPWRPRSPRSASMSNGWTVRPANARSDAGRQHRFRRRRRYATDLRPGGARQSALCRGTACRRLRASGATRLDTENLARSGKASGRLRTRLQRPQSGSRRGGEGALHLDTISFRHRWPPRTPRPHSNTATSTPGRSGIRISRSFELAARRSGACQHGGHRRAELVHHIASRAFVTANPAVIARRRSKALAKVAAWSKAHRTEVAALLSAGTGVPWEYLELRAIQRNIRWRFCR